MPEKYSAVTMPERKRMASMYSEGMTHAQIGEALGRPATTVQQTLKRAGVPARRRGPQEGHLTKLTPEVLERTRFMYERLGWSQHEIAAHEGVDQNTIVWRMRQAGVPRRGRSEALKLAFKRRPMSERRPAR